MSTEQIIDIRSLYLIEIFPVSLRKSFPGFEDIWGNFPRPFKIFTSKWSCIFMHKI